MVFREFRQINIFHTRRIYIYILQTQEDVEHNNIRETCIEDRVRYVTATTSTPPLPAEIVHIKVQMMRFLWGGMCVHDGGV